ncbi:hypothetical protein AKG34_14000 [Peribacillus butanolivorans]|nr:hypothetical protein AKG34_14000 [Peribacillus butanolivorans]
MKNEFIRRSFPGELFFCNVNMFFAFVRNIPNTRFQEGKDEEKVEYNKEQLFYSGGKLWNELHG